jgi:hypothetical protein
MKPLLIVGAMAFAVMAADQATLDRGKKDESTACTPCHSLRLVHSQRLSKATWSKELDKMTGWGTKMQDRDALLEYLAATYGDDKPAIPPPLSPSGVPRKQ